MQEKRQKISPIKQRILQFADTLNISKRDFYKKIGVSRGTLESKTGITEDVMTKFIATFQNISVEWLITGEGEMFKTTEPAAEPCDLVIDCKYLIDKIEKQAEEIGRLKAENEQLKRALVQKGSSAGCVTAV